MKLSTKSEEGLSPDILECIEKVDSAGKERLREFQESQKRSTRTLEENLAQLQFFDNPQNR